MNRIIAPTLMLALVLPAAAGTFDVQFTGSLIYKSGNHWDDSVQVGTPFTMRASCFDPAPESYDWGGYTTYVYRQPPARMTLEVGNYQFDAGRIDVTLWNNFGYSGTPVDGYHFFTDTGTGPGFSEVLFLAALQSSATDLLPDKLLPVRQLPVERFDKLCQMEMNVRFAGYGYPDNLGFLTGTITGFTVTPVPEPGALSWLAWGSGMLLCAWRRARTPLSAANGPRADGNAP